MAVDSNIVIKRLNNWINGKSVKSSANEWMEKINPHNQKVISLFPCTTKAEVNKAVDIAFKDLSYGQI